MFKVCTNHFIYYTKGANNSNKNIITILFDIFIIPKQSMYGIYLHLVDFYGKCKVNIPYMEHMGGIHNTIYTQITVVLPIFIHMKKTHLPPLKPQGTMPSMIAVRRLLYFALGKRFFKEIRWIPSRELTYPTLGKGKSSSKCHFWGIC